MGASHDRCLPPGPQPASPRPAHTRSIGAASQRRDRRALAVLPRARCDPSRPRPARAARSLRRSRRGRRRTMRRSRRPTRTGPRSRGRPRRGCPMARGRHLCAASSARAGLAASCSPPMGLGGPPPPTVVALQTGRAAGTGCATAPWSRRCRARSCRGGAARRRSLPRSSRRMMRCSLPKRTGRAWPGGSPPRSSTRQSRRSSSRSAPRPSSSTGR
mmetsp:Transcript_36350/g.104670  ORF Transcript_36350/g.104670 Transcript_36350/m.104670 type:complete len:216 (+) Transcript_36350:305-952(+)